MNTKKCACLCLVLVFTLLNLLSCSRNNIKAVTVDEVEYRTYYLYSFKDADITDDYSILADWGTPTKTGYVYSNEKLKPGDNIRVWNNLLFKVAGNTISSDMFGTVAIVDKIIEVYSIKIDNNKETYIITYFDINYNKTVSNKADLEEPVKSKIEVTKERATIEYYVD